MGNKVFVYVGGAPVSNGEQYWPPAAVPPDGAGSPYTMLPAVADSFDDEFPTGSTPNLVDRGYTIINAVTGAVLTRPAGDAGNIQPWNAAGPPADQYWSQIIDSWIYIQAPAGVQVDLYKPVVLLPGDSLYARQSGTHGLGSPGPTRFNEVGLYSPQAAPNQILLDNNNRVYTTVRDDASLSFMVYDSGRFTAGAYGGGVTGKYALGGHDIRGIRYDSGLLHYTFTVDSASGEPKSTSIAGAPPAFSLGRFALRNFFSNDGTPVPQLWGIDFIRRKRNNAWIIPA